jgi:ubiquinone/menaquinone biosynthesis C-methylase UbiE
MMLDRIVRAIVKIFLLAIAWHTLVRVIRHFYKFPMPEFLANLIDNPLRRAIQPPPEMPLRHGIEPGMAVLEVGPGNGRYTVEFARRVGPRGRVVAVDIEPKMVARVAERAAAAGVNNLEVRVADVYDLPFDDGAFDAVAMIAVISEIPDPVRAMREFHRVLAPGGSLSFSELLFDPDYPLARTLVRWAASAGFRPRRQTGNWLAYSLIFEKLPAQARE